MSPLLRTLDVLVLDCQAGGATPAYGDLLELGWAICGVEGIAGPIHDHWIVPRTERRVPRAIRDLTGWSEACVAQAVPEQEAWTSLRRALAERSNAQAPMPTLIHYARFELPFLRDLHGRLEGDAEFPFETRCVHAIGARLFPDLPRRNIRALAGFLGHSADLMRRSAGHVEATAFIWRALVPRLEAEGVHTWSDLGEWLDTAPKAVRRTRRVYPLARERRLSLPDRPGVYRFVRSNESVLYVGKAASLKKRIAGHFSSRGPSTERGLELLSQVHDIVVTETSSALEAALLEADEIKRIDPPYNVQLRRAERHAWFAALDLQSARSTPDAVYRVGPLPSERALLGLGAHRLLAGGAAPTPSLCAMVLAVPTSFLPEPSLFAEGYATFAAEHLARAERDPARRVDAAARALWLARGRNEPESSSEDASPDQWDLARVRRRLERSLVSTSLLLRRARFMRLLAYAQLAFRERGMQRARVVTVVGARIQAFGDLSSVGDLAGLPVVSRARDEAPLACFDAAAYDRLRVLVTELNRVLNEAGEVTLRIGRHWFGPERVTQLLRFL